MRNETEMLQKRLQRVGVIGEAPVWYRGRRPGSWAFVCGVCGEISYYPQNTRTTSPEYQQRVVMGYRYCPYCRTEIEKIAIERANVGKWMASSEDPDE